MSKILCYFNYFLTNFLLIKSQLEYKPHQRTYLEKLSQLPPEKLSLFGSFFVGLIYLPEGITERSVYCGGTIISLHHVLTAAHCEKKPEDILLTLSTFNLKKSLLSCFVKDFKPHPFYHNSSYFYDIAVLTTSSSFAEFPTISPILLNIKPSTSFSYAFILGFGSHESDKSTKPEVYFGSVPNETPSCSSISQRFLFDFDSELMYCSVSNMYLPNQPTWGHSGGPLFRIFNGRPVLLGIISYRQEIRLKHVATFYTSVSGCLNFIKHVLSQERDLV